MRKIIFILLSAVLSLTACKTIHEYPGEPGVDPSLIDVKLSLDIDMELNGGIYRDMESFGEIYAGERARCTIQASGEARWYVVGEDAAGKTMTVTLPEDGGFYVYDSTLQLVAASHTYGDTQAVLPEGGWVVFTGDVGAQFQIAMDR